MDATTLPVLEITTSTDQNLPSKSRGFKEEKNKIKNASPAEVR